MKLLASLFLIISINTFAQLNDTLVFKTGYEKAVEIDSFTNNMVYFTYHNNKLDKDKKSTESTKKLRYFVTYDEEGVLTYDSRMDYSSKQPKVKVDSLQVAQHDLSVNPFLVPLLSPSIRYTYKFGNYMQWGLQTRLTYLSPIINLSGSGVFMFGAGIKFSPYYSRKFSFGLDFVPEIILADGDYAVLLPMGPNFDFYFGERFGAAIDFGVGYAFGDGYTGFAGRGNVGFLMRLGKRYNVPNQAANAGI